MKFVVYEVWTTARVVEAKDADAAFDATSPVAREGMKLCNWHVVPVPEEPLQFGEFQSLGQCEVPECRNLASWTIIDDRRRMWRVCTDPDHRKYFAPLEQELRLHLAE